MTRILVVDDEPGLREVLERLLSSAGYEVVSAGTGSAGLRQALTEKFDLILLDLMLPDLAGEQVMGVIVDSQPAARIVVLSSAHDPRRRVGVLMRGAADFVAKPFVNAELLARIRLRLRESTTAVEEQGRSGGRISLDSHTYLDLVRHELQVDGAAIALSQREFDLVRYLVERRGSVCTRKELLTDVWGLGFDPHTNVVDVYIGRLRAKLAPLQIETVRNVGYRLAAS
jgi:two-component system, OmpR family, response regulator